MLDIWKQIWIDCFATLYKLSALVYKYQDYVIGDGMAVISDQSEKSQTLKIHYKSLLNN